MFGILGPLVVSAAGRTLPVAGPKLRGLLAILVVNANRVVSTDQLLHELWDGSPPSGALHTLHSHVSHLRKALGPAGSSLGTRPPGYVLEAEPDAVDAGAF